MRPRSTSIFFWQLILSYFLKIFRELIVKCPSSCGYNQIQRVYSNSSFFSFKFSQNRHFMMKELAQSRFFFPVLFPPVLHSKLTALKIFYSEEKNVRASKNVNRITTKFLTEIVHNFGRKSNISERTLHSLPWCFFVRNFHLLSRAKGWSLKQNRFGGNC